MRSGVTDAREGTNDRLAILSYWGSLGTENRRLEVKVQVENTDALSWSAWLGDIRRHARMSTSQKM